MMVHVDCATFLLPHLVTHVIKTSRDTHPSVMAEIRAVIDDNDDENSANSERNESKDSTGGGGENKKRLAAQTVFGILDHLKKWLRTKYMEVTAEVGKGGDPTAAIAKHNDYQDVNRFLDKMPHKIVCRASLACEANARALLHLEKHLKAKPEEMQVWPLTQFFLFPFCEK